MTTTLTQRPASVALVAAALALAPTAGATTTFYVPGTSTTPATAGPVNLAWLDKGRIATAATQIGYPASLWPLAGKDTLNSSAALGQEHLNTALLSTPGPKQVVCVSQGCVVSADEVRALAGNKTAPTDISFVDVADPTSPYGFFGRNPNLTVPGLGITMVSQVPSPYTTMVVIRQYDGVADWPANQLNVLADLNALAGAAYLHEDYSQVNLRKITPTKVGNTTYYIQPTHNLPLLQPLRDLGVDKRLVNALQKVLKPIIDSAYAPLPKAKNTKTGKHRRNT